MSSFYRHSEPFMPPPPVAPPPPLTSPRSKKLAPTAKQLSLGADAALIPSSKLKRRAPLAPAAVPPPPATLKTSLSNHSLPTASSCLEESKLTTQLRNSIEALTSTELTTLLKCYPTLFGRMLRTIASPASSDEVAAKTITALHHFVWQMCALGQSRKLRAYVKYEMFVDYDAKSECINEAGVSTTLHEAILKHLHSLIVEATSCKLKAHTSCLKSQTMMNYK